LRKWPGLACLYMRPERTPKALENIQDAAAFILEATEGKRLDDYSRDRLLRNAVERKFEVIGEAVGRLLRNDLDAASRLSQHERIVAFRNVLIHGYDLVDDELVWDTVTSKLPVLLSEVEALLREEFS
jgi:uncharacterized protein with HEPN domain